MQVLTCGVLVVGAGPAGSSAAAAAARAGADVLVLESRREVGVPVQCAEYVPIQLLTEVDLPRTCLVQPIHGMRTFLNGRDAHFMESKGYMIRRDLFDQALAHKAMSAGATVMTSVRVLGRNPDGMVLVRDRCLGETFGVNAQVVIGADGPRSTVAGWVRDDPMDMIPAVQYTMPLQQSSNETEVYLEPEIVAGYGWLFPKKNFVNIGLGMRRTGDDGLSLVGMLDKFVERFRSSGRVGDQILSRATGWIPVAPMDSAVCGEVLLVGDAAGHTHPITGAGIFAAVMCGKMAGERSAEAVARGDLGLLSKYDADWRGLFGRTLTRAAERRTFMEAEWQNFNTTVHRSWVAFREYYVR